MKIGIIGFGFVGKAVHSILKNPDQALILDPNYFDTTLELMETFAPDIIFLCVPTPSTPFPEDLTGRSPRACDDSLIIKYVKDLKDFPGLLVIKSTIPPATVDRVMNLRPTTVVWPEMLRESYANQDIKWPDIIVVGAPSDVQFSYVQNFIEKHSEIHHSRDIYSAHGLGPSRRSLINRCTPVEASIFKYTVNSFLAMKTLYFHQLYQWMERSDRGDSYTKITELLSKEGRIGSTHMKAPGDHGLGYAGNCFPKDVEAFLHQVYHKDVTSFPLLNQVHEVNLDMRNSPVNKE